MPGVSTRVYDIRPSMLHPEMRVSADAAPTVVLHAMGIFDAVNEPRSIWFRKRLTMLEHAYLLREVSRYRIADLRAAACRPCALLARLWLI